MMKPKEARVIRENARKKTQLRFLDETCEGVLRERGTLKLLFNYDYWVDFQIQRCKEAGATKEEVQAILNKYE